MRCIGTHQAAALYSGLASSPVCDTSSPVLLVKGSDMTTTAVAAGAAFSYSVSPCLVKPADVPFGYLYAGFTMTGTAVCTLAGAARAQAAKVNIQHSTNQPSLSGTSSSGLAGVPGSTLTLAAPTHQPVIVLTYCRVSRLQCPERIRHEWGTVKIGFYPTSAPYCSRFTTSMMSCDEGTIPTSWRTGIRNFPKAS